MTEQNFQPRLNISITEEQFFALQKIQWGVKTALFQTIIDDLLSLINEHGVGIVTGAILERKANLEQICKLKLKKKG
jgi:hypothetical protein